MAKSKDKTPYAKPLSEKPAVKKTEGSLKARKMAARLGAVQVLYQMRLNNQDAASAMREFIDHRVGFNLDGDVFVPADADTLQEIVTATTTRWADIDAAMSAALAEGKRGEVETLLDCILRAGIAEIMSRGDIDVGIIINDYLSVAAAFYDGNEPKIVNAILDKIAKSVRD